LLSPEAVDRRAPLEVQALHEIAGAVFRDGDINKALTSALLVLRLVLDMENGTVSLFDPVTGDVFIEAAPEMRDDERIQGRLRPGEGIVGRIYALGVPVVVPDLAAEPAFLNRTGSWSNLVEDPRALVGVPIRHGRETLGVLTIDRRLRAGEPSFERDVRFLGIVAAMIGARVRLDAHESPRARVAVEDGAPRPAPLAARLGIVAAGVRTRGVLDQVERVARSRATVLLRGESGTGKEVIARAVHEASPRAERAFVAVNCAALPDTLVENELFGHDRGAFTGATVLQKGRFELADGGTLFLDEIGELSVAAQVKLLRVLQERQFERVGGGRTVTVDVRIVAATNRDLEAAVRQGTFRLDLYHRLSVVTLDVPPLRERTDEIAPLTEHFLRALAREHGRDVTLARDALDALVRHRWPGNVRELRNTLERAVVITAGHTIRAADLALDARAGLDDRAPPPGAPAGEDERERVRAALERCGYVQAKAARVLGLSTRQLAYRVRKYGISLERF
jgi:Nif-specific regulatory protein